MFNLGQAIAKWREQMLSSGLKSRADLDELEGHLRDEISQQFANGVDADEAFQAAIKQIGSVKALNAEFKKIDDAAKAREYKTNKIICAIGFAVYGTFSIRGLFGSFDATPGERLLGLTAVGITGLLLLPFVNAWRFAPVIASRRMRLSVAIASAVIGALITGVIFDLMAFSFHLNLAQVIVVTLWALIPLTVGGAICSTILEAADRRLTS